MKPTHIVLDPDSTVKITKNFKANEITCKCGDCHATFISIELMDKLQLLREEYGKSITITSGYRCPEHNRKIGGAKKSQHVLGNAVDVTSDDLATLYKLCEKHFDSVGDGRPKGFVHIDSRPGKRRWTY